MGFFEDAFTAGTTTDLAAHTPDVGTSWTRLWGTDASTRRLEAVSGGAGVRCNGNSGDYGLIYTADASYPTANYEVQATFVTVFSTSTPLYLLARVQDQENMYAVRLVTGASGAQLYKKVSGTWSTLGSAATIAAGSVVKLSVNGSTIKLYDDGVEVVSVTDSAISAAGKAGLAHGGGAELVNSLDDTRTTVMVDTFSVTDLGAGGRTGTLSITLDDATVSAAGDVFVEGAVSITTDDATLSAAGDVFVVASLSVTLDDATLSSAGTVGSAARTGELSVTLDDATVVAAAAVSVAGVLSVALDDAVCVAAGTVAISAQLNVTLDAATLSAAGVVGDAPITGSLSVTLDDATCAATAVVLVDATLSATLDDATLSAAADVFVAAQLAITLDDATLTATGIIGGIGVGIVYGTVSGAGRTGAVRTAGAVSNSVSSRARATRRVRST